MTLSKKIKIILERFVERPNVYTIGEEYYCYVNFLIGVFAVHDNIGFSSFLKKKYSLEFSIHWSIFILKELNEENQIKAKRKLLVLIKEYSETLNS